MDNMIIKFKEKMNHAIHLEVVFKEGNRNNERLNL